MAKQHNIRQAIETKYIGPGNVRGSRYKATSAAGSIIVDADDALSPEDNHCLAAQMLAAKKAWRGEWWGGQLKSGHYVFVVSDADNGPAFKIWKPKV